MEIEINEKNCSVKTTSKYAMPNNKLFDFIYNNDKIYDTMFSTKDIKLGKWKSDVKIDLFETDELPSSSEELKKLLWTDNETIKIKSKHKIISMAQDCISIKSKTFIKNLKKLEEMISMFSDETQVIVIKNNCKMIRINDKETQMVSEYEMIINDMIPSNFKKIIKSFFIEFYETKIVTLHNYINENIVA